MKIRQTVDKILGNVLAVLMGVMVINVLWQVFTRFVLGSPSAFTDELARYLLIWVGVLGAAYVSGKKMHIAIDLFSSHLSVGSKRVLGLIIDALILAFIGGVFVMGGARLIYITFILGQKSAALQIPLAFVYTVIPISGLLIMYYKISDNLTKPS